MGDGDFVREVLAGSNERYDRKYRLKSLGYDISKVERKVIDLCNIQTSLRRAVLPPDFWTFFYPKGEFPTSIGKRGN